MTGREGQLTIQGDRAVLTFERRLPYPIEAVWSAITDPGERAQWFGETMVDAREGGLIDMVATGPPLPTEKKRMTGHILVWDPPHVLEHERKQAIVEDSVVRYELHPDGDGTLLRFSHRGLGARNATGFRAGTHAYLDRLEAYLAGDELPDWATQRQEIFRSTTGVEITRHTMVLISLLQASPSHTTRGSATPRCWPTPSPLAHGTRERT